MSKYIVARANFLTLGSLIGLLILIGGVTWDRMDAARSAREWSRHSYEVLATIKDLNLTLRDAETGQRGYLLTGNDEYLTPYQGSLDRISFLQGELQRLTVDNQFEQEHLRMLAPALVHKLDELAQTIQLRRNDGFDAAIRIVQLGSGREYMKTIEATLSAMTGDEQKLLAQRLAAADSRGAWLRWLILACAIVAITALLWAVRLLNQAWARSSSAEVEHRTVAERLNTSLNSLSQGVAVFGPNHNLRHWNDCFQVLLNLPKAMLRESMPYVAFVEQTAEGGKPFLESEDQIRHGGTIANEPIVYEHTTEHGHQLEIRRTPVSDGGFALTISDMTRRAQAEGVLREAQKMQAIGQLTGGIAHDFNNLLTVILGNLEIVRAKMGDNDAQLGRIERATWAASRGAVLTGQLLAFARKQPLAPAPINLTAAMPNLIPLLQRTLGEHIEVRYVETAGLWPAMADPAQLESAVLNLALNARDAMPEGGQLTIELGNRLLDDQYARAHSEVTPGDYAMLAVSDTGHGMTADVVAHAFDPFFTTKSDGKGTGLGLAMVFGFVKQSGGHIKIYSEPGEGTTIRLYLPRAAANAATAEQRTRLPIALPRGSATVLVVEDEAAVREIAVAILRDLGYRVLEAADGDEGLRVFGDHMGAIDLLLTDVVLPGKVRGRQLAERITEIRPDVRILFMSGYTENSIVHQGRLDDGVQLIGKPLRREALARKVAEVLGTLEAEAPNAVDGENVVELKRRREN
jgi:signal transduction histidine kinase/CHASE3 domain sensor protein/CheY-like chemotaxis protein